MAYFNYSQGMTLLAPVTLLLSLVISALFITSKTLQTVYAVNTESQYAEKAHLQAQTQIHQLSATLLQPEKSFSPLPSGQTLHSNQQVAINGTDVSIFTVSGQAQVQYIKQVITESLIKAPLLLNMPPAPFSVSSSLYRQTRLELGIPEVLVNTGSYISLWSQLPTPENASHQVSCLVKIMQTGNCLQNPLYSNKHKGADFFDDDSAFPDDIVEFLFGVERHSLALLESYAAQTISDCDSANLKAGGFYILNTDCTLSANTAIGTPTSPVLLITKNANFTFKSDSALHGMLIALCFDSALRYDIKMHSNAYIEGALMTDCDISRQSHIRVNFSPAILEMLRKAPYLQRLQRIPGSWSDF